MKKNTNKKELLISNSFVDSIIKKNNSLSLKLLFLLVYDGIIEKDKNISKITIDIKKIKENLKIDFHNLRQNLQQIQKTIITIKNNRNIVDLVLIPKCSYDYHKQTLTIDIYNEILNELQLLKNKYTIINLNNLFKLNNKHSIKFIQILEQINHYDSFIPKTKEFSKNELNELFNTNYKSVVEIDRAILKHIKDELDELSNLSFIYDYIYDIDTNKKGRKPILGIKIYLKENKQRQLKMF